MEPVTFVCVDVSGSTRGSTFYWDKVAELIKDKKDPDKYMYFTWSDECERMPHGMILLQKPYGQTFPHMCFQRVTQEIQRKSTWPRERHVMLITDGMIENYIADRVEMALVKLFREVTHFSIFYINKDSKQISDNLTKIVAKVNTHVVVQESVISDKYEVPAVEILNKVSDVDLKKLLLAVTNETYDEVFGKCKFLPKEQLWRIKKELKDEMTSNMDEDLLRELLANKNYDAVLDIVFNTRAAEPHKLVQSIVDKLIDYRGTTSFLEYQHLLRAGSSQVTETSWSSQDSSSYPTFTPFDKPPPPEEDALTFEPLDQTFICFVTKNSSGERYINLDAKMNLTSVAQLEKKKNPFTNGELLKNDMIVLTCHAAEDIDLETSLRLNKHILTGRSIYNMHLYLTSKYGEALVLDREGDTKIQKREKRQMFLNLFPEKMNVTNNENGQLLLVSKDLYFSVLFILLFKDTSYRSASVRWFFRLHPKLKSYLRDEFICKGKTLTVEEERVFETKEVLTKLESMTCMSMAKTYKAMQDLFKDHPRFLEDETFLKFARKQLKWNFTIHKKGFLAYRTEDETRQFLELRTGGKSEETGDKSEETGGKSEETGDKDHTGDDKSEETGDKTLESNTGDKDRTGDDTILQVRTRTLYPPLCLTTGYPISWYYDCESSLITTEKWDVVFEKEDVPQKNPVEKRLFSRYRCFKNATEGILSYNYYNLTEDNYLDYFTKQFFTDIDKLGMAYDVLFLHSKEEEDFVRQNVEDIMVSVRKCLETDDYLREYDEKNSSAEKTQSLVEASQSFAQKMLSSAQKLLSSVVETKPSSQETKMKTSEVLLKLDKMWKTGRRMSLLHGVCLLPNCFCSRIIRDPAWQEKVRADVAKTIQKEDKAHLKKTPQKK